MTGGGTGTGTITGGGTGTGTITGGGTGTGTITGGGGTGTMTGPCLGNKMQNCEAYGKAVCTDPQYTKWVQENCCMYCMTGGTGTGTGTGTMTGTGTGTITGGGTGTGTGTITGGGTGTGTGTITGGGTGTMTGGGTGTMTGPCLGNKMQNCEAYGKAVCTDPQYTKWVQENCCMYCMAGMTGTQTGTGTGTQTGTGTGTGTGGVISGNSMGCAYKGQVYGQGQSWNDGCTYRCTCVDASKGQYNCNDPCYTFNLPPQCSMQGPAPGKCCKTPSCPAGVNIQYPPGYAAN